MTDHELLISIRSQINVQLGAEPPPVDVPPPVIVPGVQPPELVSAKWDWLGTYPAGVKRLLSNDYGVTLEIGHGWAVTFTTPPTPTEHVAQIVVAEYQSQGSTKALTLYRQADYAVLGNTQGSTCQLFMWLGSAATCPAGIIPLAPNTGYVILTQQVQANTTPNSVFLDFKP